jgi:hypothetical protein
MTDITDVTFYKPPYEKSKVKLWKLASVASVMSVLGVFTL